MSPEPVCALIVGPPPLTVRDDVVFVQGAAHGEEKVGFHCARPGLRIEIEMGAAAELQGNIPRTGLQLPRRSKLAADLQSAGTCLCLDRALYIGQLDRAGTCVCNHVARRIERGMNLT